MRLSEYYTPTRVVFGRGAEKKAGELTLWSGCKKVLVHYGSERTKKSGLLDTVLDSLKQSGIGYVLLGGVKANPVLSLVYQGIELGKKEGVDMILAVGGGSVIDSAKAIAYGIANDFDVWKLFTGEKTAAGCLKNACVLTIAAAGSEMSNSCVITKDEGLQKQAYNDDISRPVYALMNPELTYTLPQYQTMSGCADIMMHTMERYFTIGERLELTDRVAEELLKTVMENAKILLKKPDDYQARAEVMWAGSISHNGLTNFGGPGGDFATHKLEHELSALFDVAHGAGLAALWGSWARYVMKEDIGRFARFAVNVMGVEMGDPQQTAVKGIEAMEAFFRSTGMPVSMSDMDIKADDALLDELADRCSHNGTVTCGSFKVLKRDNMRDIYKLAK